MILSEIEQRIKAKIEAIGTPLKEWNISINYGIKTGFNDAFIINGEKRAELIAQDPKSAEIIRPILRGRDIKRYGYDFADLYLINTHNGVKEKGIKRIHIEDYPAVKAHLDLYYPQLEKRADQGDTPYNLRNCAYIEDFYKQKIVYQELTQGSCFYLDKDATFFVSNTGYLITGENLDYLILFLNSKFIEFIFKKFYSVSLGGTGIRWLAQCIENLPIPLCQDNNYLKLQTEEEIENYIYETFDIDQEDINLINSF